MGAFGLFLFAIGLFNLLAPRAAWFASIGWKIRDAEPSDAYLVLHRIGGGIACFIAVLVLIGSFSHTSNTLSASSLRKTLSEHQIESVQVNLQNLQQQNASDLKTWILDAKWQQPAIDYSHQNSFSDEGEVDLTLDNGTDISVFAMGSGEFGISNNTIYPDYVFTSTSLANWFAQNS